jgi:hypothetical protein
MILIALASGQWPDARCQIMIYNSTHRTQAQRSALRHRFTCPHHAKFQLRTSTMAATRRRRHALNLKTHLVCASTGSLPQLFLESSLLKLVLPLRLLRRSTTRAIRSFTIPLYYPPMLSSNLTYPLPHSSQNHDTFPAAGKARSWRCFGKYLKDTIIHLRLRRGTSY